MYEFTKITKEEIKNKKIAAIDYGVKKVGIATTDIFHITFNPIATIENNERLLDKLNEIFKKENIEICIIGFPVRNNKSLSTIHQNIIEFKERFETLTGKKCIFYDESLSSKTAKKNMVEIGIPKQKRQAKKDLDKFAAMIILKNFIEEIEG